MAVYVGMRLHGYCNGYFGRDSYSSKVIEGVGANWIVARESVGEVRLATFTTTEEMEACVAEWVKAEEDDDDE